MLFLFMTPTKKLTNLQQEILKLYAQQVTKADLYSSCTLIGQ